jgi:hypothetical protein
VASCSAIPVANRLPTAGIVLPTPVSSTPASGLDYDDQLLDTVEYQSQRHRADDLVLHQPG